MKTNLDSLFGTNLDNEKDGIWFDISEDTGFRLRRFGGNNERKVKEALAQYHAPYSRQFENKTIHSDKEKEILVKVFCHACVVDWKGIESEGSELECSFENSVKLFTKLPELFTTLYEYSNDLTSFRDSMGND